MSVLVFAETSEGKFKKSAFEVTSYGGKIAEQLGTTLVVLTINSNEPSLLYNYGAEKVLSVSNENLKTFNAKIVANVIKQAAEKENSKIVKKWAKEMNVSKTYSGIKIKEKELQNLKIMKNNRVEGNYEVRNKIGEGTYGTVFLAEDIKTKKQVAIKKVKLRKPDDGMPIEAIREI